jgi:peptide/nickel transport system ATP-binding protein
VTEILKVENLEIAFLGRKRGQSVRAVDDISFAVRKGETFGIIGESGSGKSTVGRCVVCLLPPTGGSVTHFGKNPFALSWAELRKHRRSFQIIFQDPNAALDPRMTIVESVREPLDVAGIGNSDERTVRALAMLDRVALAPDLAYRYPHEISGGQKQRANIARALVLEPTLIVCDEVVAALDVSIQADMLNLFADLQRDFGLTYLFISHDLAVVRAMADYIIVMKAGKIVEEGPTDEIFDRPADTYTRALMAAAVDDKRFAYRGD